MNTYSFIATINAPTSELAQAVAGEMQSPLNEAKRTGLLPNNVEVTVGQLVDFDAQNMIDCLTGDLLKQGFGRPADNIDSDSVVDLINGHAGSWYYFDRLRDLASDSAPDRNLSAEQLDEKYWLTRGGQHPVHTRTAWRDEVHCMRTIFGYRDWVYNQVQEG